MALKLKCGSTFASITWISLARLPDLISLSLAMRSTTSSVTFFTSTSGASCARTAPTQMSAARPRKVLIRFLLVAFIIGVLFPWRLTVVHQAAPALQIGIALEHVAVERCLLEDSTRIQKVGARLDQEQGHQAPARLPRISLVDRVRIKVESFADAVPHGCGAQNGQHEIRARSHAPVAERLAEILVVLFIAHVGRDVVNPQDAEAGIERYPHPVVEAVGELALQDVVHADEHVADVAEEIAHAVADLAGYRLAVAGGDRPSNVLVQLVVDTVDAAVPALEWVACLLAAQARTAAERQRGKRQHHAQHHFVASFGSALASGLPSAALLKRNWLIRFSSTTADWVSRSRSPFFSMTPSPPASSPTYCSPRMPEVRILAVVSRGNWYFASRFMDTTASNTSLSKRMSATRPTTTPALLIGARIFRPPMLAKRASTR